MIRFALLAVAVVGGSVRAEEPAAGWPGFRGDGGRGVAEGFATATEWDADPKSETPKGVLWSADVPGLGHSSPVVSGDRVFLTTAVAEKGDVELKVGRGGEPDPADDDGPQQWLVLCYDLHTGAELWRRVARQGEPRATRHIKSTHANASVAVSGDRVVAAFGSEGVHCFDLNGGRIWSRDLGLIDVGKYGIGWGFAASPAIHGDRIALVCDDAKEPFLAVLDLADGSDVWRVDRTEDCARSWGTACVHRAGGRTQVVVNGWPAVVSYDLQSGEELWRINGGGDNPVPTPFEAHGLLYVTSSHGGKSPIYVVRPTASGDLTPLVESDEAGAASDAIAWSTLRGGSYMSTPVVYDGRLYLGNTNGVVRCYDAVSGEKVYERRLGGGASVVASLVASDGKVYCVSENGDVYVVAAGAEYRLLARNPMGEPCFATPAIAEGVVFIRTTRRLVAVGG